MHRVALRNIARAKEAGALRAPVVAHRKDVTDYELPKEPFILYLFNPFGEAVVSKLLDNLEASLRDCPREGYLIYLNAKHRHCVDRRLFLQGGVTTALGVGLAGFGAPQDSLAAAEIRKQKKHVLLLWLAGGASQLETFDPKPGRPTGGPFKAIPTAVPGIHICELLPKMARIMDRVALVRSLDTRIAEGVYKR